MTANYLIKIRTESNSQRLMKLSHTIPTANYLIKIRTESNSQLSGKNRAYQRNCELSYKDKN